MGDFKMFHLMSEFEELVLSIRMIASILRVEV